MSQQIIYKKRNIASPEGAIAEVTANSIDVHDSHVHAEFFNVHFRRSLGEANKRSIAAPISAGDYEVEITDAESVFAENDKFELCEGMEPYLTCERDVLKVVSITTDGSNRITLDRPVDNAYTTAGFAQKVSLEMHEVGGSVANPVVYRIPTYKPIHVTELIVFMKTTLAPKDGKFGDLDALTNGIIFKVFRNDGRTETPFIPFRFNLSFKGSGFDVTYGSLNLGLNGTVVAKKSLLEKEGAVIELVEGDYLSVSVQDLEVTDLLGLEAKVSGHTIESHNHI